jgi:hypothetical protein
LKKGILSGYAGGCFFDNAGKVLSFYIFLVEICPCQKLISPAAPERILF